MTAADPSGAAGRGAVMRRCWSNPRLRRLLAAYLLFNIAEWASYIALLVWAYEQDGVRGSSAIALVQLVPAAVAAPVLVGRLARVRGPRALRLGYAVQGVAALVLGTAILADVHVAVVAVMAAAYSCALTCTRPVHHSLLPEISDTTSELTAGNAGSGSVEAAATFLGPLASGALVMVWAAGGVLVVMGLGSMVAVLLAAGLGAGVPRVPATRSGRGRSTLRVALADPAARLLSGLVVAEYVLVGMMDILLVVLALDRLGMPQGGPGLLNSAIGVGGLVGASATVVLIGARRLLPFVLLGAVMAGIPFALAGVASSVHVAMTLIALCGAGKLFFDVASRTLIQRLLPDSLFVAVFGLQETSMMAGLVLGSVAAPVLVTLVSPEAAFLVAGSLLPLVALSVWRQLRRLDAAAIVPADTLALLSHVPMLSVLAPRVVERLAVFAGHVSSPPATPVVTEGETGDLFYVIKSGHVVVSHGADRIRALGPGDWFGELALLDPDARRTATVTTEGPVQLATIDQHAFLTALAGASRSRTVADDYARDHYS